MVAWALAAVLWAAKPAEAGWSYKKLGGKKPGTLSTVSRKGAEYVSLRQFCFALGCKAFYQWANYRVVIQNPSTHEGAIVSRLAHVALVDGKAVDFDGDVLSEEREGYLLPLDLSVKLAVALGLGRVERKEAERPEKIAQGGHELKSIVIDPGHGGNDFGTGFGGTYEKDVAMFYALRLREQVLKDLPGVTVLLTRENDSFVSLPDRARLANASGASLFLSLHVNHAGNPEVQGVETYILSPDATDDDARKLALLENDTWLKTSKTPEAGDNVKKILIDMEQTKYIQDSAFAASMIQQELTGLDKRRGLRNRGVKQAMFYVLAQVAMPSTLVEMGFLSNTGDRSRLMDAGFREDFVRAVVGALRRYGDKLKGK
jgi:N-acetylmuramoyl-L-alanine amidase